MIGRYRRRVRISLGVTTVIGMLAAGLVACGSSSGGTGSPGDAGPSSSTTVAPSATAVPTSHPRTTGSPASSATTQAVSRAYTRLFAPDTPLAVSIKSLQQGEKFKQALIEQGRSPLAKKSGAKVTDVTMISPDTARVTYAILLGGTPILSGQTGYAVREDGTWKVADVTFCGLLAMNGTTPDACKTAAATTVPS